MASSYSQIYQYRDPVQLDISSTLGKAATFKQENYDINTSAVQQLVNQYVGTDLLRPLDQEYLGNRLKTLTNFVNQAGTMDWSRKTIANDAANYIGQALDNNVMAGIASTKSFRAHQAYMEDLKKNKPELYAVQNDWMSTRGLEDYMKSGKLGEVYRTSSYVPYTDVKKELLENSKYLKDFGVETYIDASDNNVYFKTIKTGEKITKDKANQYIDLVLGQKGKTQLMIDGIYNYKDIPEDKLKEEYNNHVGDIADNYTQSAKALRLAATNSPKLQKERYLAEANKMDDMANQTNASKGLLTDRDSIASNLYVNQFKQKWSNMLSFDRIKDWKIDDSGMQVAKHEHSVRQDTISNNFKLADLELKRQGLGIDQQKLAIEQQKLVGDLMSKGLTVDENGNIVEDVNSSRNPLNANSAEVTVTQDPKKLEKIKKQPITQIFQDYDTAWGMAIQDGSAGITAKLDDPQYSQLRKELNFEGKDAKFIINSMIVNPQDYNKLLNILDPNTKDLVRKAQGAYKQKESIKKEAQPIYDEVTRFSNGMYVTPGNKTLVKTDIRTNFNLFQGGLGLDAKGNLVKRDVRSSNTLEDRVVREIGVINSMIAQESGITDDRRQLLQQRQTDLLKTLGLSNSQYAAAKDKLIYRSTGFWEGGLNNVAKVASKVPFLISQVKMVDNAINYLNRDDSGASKSNMAGSIEKAADKSDLTNNSFFSRTNQSNNTRGVFGYMADQVTDTGRANYDINDSGNSDIKGVTEASTFMNRVNGYMKDVEEEALAKVGSTQFLNTINVDLSDKLGKSILGNIKANLPVGSEIQSDGNVQYTIDPSTGQATMIVPVKQDKEIVPMQIEIPISAVPSQILNKVNLSQKNELYSAQNPNALGYKGYAEIPTSRAEWNSKVDLMPIQERTQAVNNPPKTQEDIIKDMSFLFGKELVIQNQKEIQEILSTPVNFEMVPEEGQWTMVGKQGNSTIMRKHTGEQYMDPDLTDKLINKLGTEKIIENVKLLLKNKQ